MAKQHYIKQDSIDIVHIQGGYYAFSVLGDHMKIFGTRAQALELVFSYLRNRSINEEKMKQLMVQIADLDIPFIWHEPQTLPEERPFIEKNIQAKLSVTYAVLTSGIPDLCIEEGVNNVQGYIITPNYESDKFDKLEDGSRIITKIFDEKHIQKRDITLLIGKVFRIFHMFMAPPQFQYFAN